ncbi:hypothetical protein ACFFGT_04115 [Mucilaginibacter angelicae]|uniref:Methyltransferase n=1 Tax=Mucilaginibacter angelicae TaxID=869718 RepID=A0ABV6L133_9SPHI
MQINVLLKPFAGDTYIEKSFLKFKKKMKIVNAIETGTNMGSTFAWLYNNFDRVYTCESDEGYYQGACKRIFSVNSKYKMDHYPSQIVNPPDMGEMIIANSDSVSFLKMIGPQLSGESIFFLDAHWYDDCPLYNELLTIADLGLSPAVIAIHDFKTDHPDELGYDTYGGQSFDLAWITPAVNQIYGSNWTYEYNKPETSAGAKRGIIYIKRASK